MQKKIAITGGIGSGKSLASKYIAEMGYPVVSCDEINRKLWQDPQYMQRIKTLFPFCVKEDKLDKNALKELVFSDKTALASLNKTAHPFIMERLFTAMESNPSDLIFAEVPLLFEENYEKDFDQIIVITRALNERINAVKQRDGLSEEEINNRINAQFDYSTLQKRIENLNAFVVNNEGNELALKNKIKQVVAQLK